MPVVINTNVLSLNAQRNLSRSDSTLQTALQRLSSGLRINSAKDDAAGLAIANRFTTQIRGLNQAVRNANDGISLAQTAESALDELTNNLQRIRELAVQAANSTNSASDRAALDQEVQQRLAEVNRIASQTSFNGQKVLDGSFGSAQFQVGANVGETIQVNLTTGVRADQLGQIATSTGTAVSANALTDGSVTIAVGNNAAVQIRASTAGSQAGQTSDSAYAKLQAINGAGVSGLTATATNVTSGTFSTVSSAGGTSTYNLTINGVAIYSGTGNIADGGSLTAADVAAQVNLFSAQTGVSASVSGTTFTLTAADGRNVVVAESIANATGTASGTGIAAAQEGTLRGTLTLSASENITLGGAPTDIGFAGVTSIAKDTTTLSTVAVTSVSAANTAIQRVDAALTSVSSLRSQFGAIQNRFESTISNLQAVAENLTASRSRIQDADFAAETAALTKAQILQQAGVAVLAQANAAPQVVLGLLRG
ncbi:MAG: flagellin [Gammaproteobacteria bacterium]|nr:MAG: flagellin [Pseudomonadota bacterium]MBC6944220.1 flagellin [Gammaproteobacteria bacterium]MCE7895820.1 flagellin [Gammaproteobacteria bacterium PRO8]MDL1879523.1 flagellin [Gammaproteobacteria bacterium PRO2]MCL4777552.1 flagellin [Gammaproteobacteria bacterium]